MDFSDYSLMRSNVIRNFSQTTVVRTLNFIQQQELRLGNYWIESESCSTSTNLSSVTCGLHPVEKHAKPKTESTSNWKVVIPKSETQNFNHQCCQQLFSLQSASRHVSELTFLPAFEQDSIEITVSHGEFHEENYQKSRTTYHPWNKLWLFTDELILSAVEIGDGIAVVDIIACSGVCPIHCYRANQLSFINRKSVCSNNWNIRRKCQQNNASCFCFLPKCDSQFDEIIDIFGRTTITQTSKRELVFKSQLVMLPQQLFPIWNYL